MVINSTNINKTKESLNSDGQQLNSDGQQLKEFQQSKPLILTELTEHKKNPTAYGVGNPDTDLGQVQHVAWINQLM